MLALFLATFTFTSCEDVPEPYTLPGESGGNGGQTTEIEPAGTGTAADPFNVAAVQEEAAKLASGETATETVYFKGIVSSIKEEFSTTYGNATFFISDDGTTTNQFYIYRAYYLDNKKFTDGDTQIQIGDTVVICGKLTNYSGTLETAQNGAYIYSISGKTSGGNTGGETGGATGDGTLENPFNSVAANNYASSLASDATSDKDVYIKGKVVSIKEQYNTQYGNATFFISDDGTETNQFYVYRALYLNNEKYTSGTLLQVGDDVIICGKVTNYKGNTPETSQGNAYLYSLTSNGGGNTGDDTGDTSSANGDFETWTNGIPNNWKSSSSASNADLSQSTDAHSGSYSVKVGGNSSNNKRLSYKELTLSPGDYTMTFYAKAATSTGASLRPGYAIVSNGSISGGDSYKYGSYVNDITTEWQQVTHTFTIDTEGTYCVLIMNAKKPGGDLLIDDFTLTMGTTVIIK